MNQANPRRVWTVAEAKARLSEVLRLAETEGPQEVGTKRRFVIVPADSWYGRNPERKPLGKWLVENMPRGTHLEIPEDEGPERPIPFIDEDGDGNLN